MAFYMRYLMPLSLALTLFIFSAADRLTAALRSARPAATPGYSSRCAGRLLEEGDYYMHLADLGSYTAAQKQVSALYRDGVAWARKAILNIAASGHFSSDRTIREHARDIWQTAPSPVPA